MYSCQALSYVLRSLLRDNACFQAFYTVLS